MFEAKRSKWWFGLFAAATFLAARAGKRYTRPSATWYRALSKPAGQPPDWAFAPVWTTLYGLMAWSAYRVFKHRSSPERTRALRLWWTQLAQNASWTPLFFGARRGRLALADLAGTLASGTAYCREAYKVDAPAAWMMTPYLAWLGYAGYLNVALVSKNRRLLA